MRQEINLYQEQFRPKPIAFPARRIAVIAGLALLTLLCISLLQAFSLQQSRAELLKAQAAVQGAEQKLIAYLTQYPKPQPDAQLPERIAQLEKTIAYQNSLISALTLDIDSGARGFSPFLSAMARQTVPQVWLTQIYLYDGGQQMALRGETLDPGKMPLLLTAYSREEIFRGLDFEAFSMERSQHDPAIAQFTLGTPRPSRILSLTNMTPLQRFQMRSQGETP